MGSDTHSSRAGLEQVGSFAVHAGAAPAIEGLGCPRLWRRAVVLVRAGDLGRGSVECRRSLQLLSEPRSKRLSEKSSALGEEVTS